MPSPPQFKNRHPAPNSKKGKVQWRSEMVLDIYLYAKSGMTQQQIAEALGVSKARFSRWLNGRRPAALYAWERGHATLMENKNNPTFVDYVLGHLDPEARSVWQQIELWEEGADAYDQVKALFDLQPDLIQQQLFVHSLVSCSFDVHKALKRICLSKRKLELWTSDPNFNKLMEEMKWHKKNFFEGSLVDLVKAKNSAAVIFANKTLNADRGYGEKMEMQVSGQVNVVHTLVPITELNLPLETKKDILRAIRERKAEVIEVQDATLDAVKA